MLVQPQALLIWREMSKRPIGTSLTLVNWMKQCYQTSLKFSYLDLKGGSLAQLAWWCWRRKLTPFDLQSQTSLDGTPCRMFIFSFPLPPSLSQCCLLLFFIKFCKPTLRGAGENKTAPTNLSVIVGFFRSWAWGREESTTPPPPPPPMYFENYSRYEKDSHVSIMTSYYAKMTSYI